VGNFLIAIGGTGQLVAVAYRRVLQMMPWREPAELFYMDRDTIVGLTNIIPFINHIDPLPGGITSETSFYDYFRDPASLRLSEDILDSLFDSEEQATPISQGMFGRPSVGASLIKARFLSASPEDGDDFAELVNTLSDGRRHIVCICGSAMGGTGAGGVPTVAQYLDERLRAEETRANVKIYILYFLRHFSLTLPRGEDASTFITNEQLGRNAASGMYYLKDRIAKGTDGCLLLGLDDAPQRDYQEVGVQREQCELLHFIASVQIERLFLKEEFPGKGLFGYGIPEDGLSMENLKIPHPSGNEISFGNLLKLTNAAIEFLVLLKKLIEPLPGFSFVPTLPRNFISALRAMQKYLKGDVLGEIIAGLEIMVKDLEEAYYWFIQQPNGLFYRSEDRYLLKFAESDLSISGVKYQKLRRRPMSFVRKWISRATFSKGSNVEAFCANLKDSLYECLDEEFFGNYIS